MAKDLQQFITWIENHMPERILRIQPTIDTQQYEITALLRVLETRKDKRMVLFETPLNVNGKDSMPFVSNVFCKRDLCAAALGLLADEDGMVLVKEFGRREAMQGSTETISTPPCQEIIRKGDDVDLWDLPIPRHHIKDVGPYFTMTCIMKGLDQEFYDITFTKNWVKDPRKMSVSAHGHHHLAKIIAAHEKRDMATPMIVVLGHHPAFNLSACSLMPYKNNDYLTASAFLEEPLRLSPSVTWGSDFLVPADAEIIIETEIPPGVRETQNPFGEIAGYYQPAMQSPVAEVKAMTMKKNAIMQGIYPGQAEHWHLGGIPKEGSLYGSLKRKFPGVKAVHLPEWGCGRFACVISLKKDLPSDPQRAAFMAFPEIEHLKMVIVVDDDIDVYNDREVHWAMVTRTFWDKDVTVIPNVQSFRKWMGEAVTIIDATRPDSDAFPIKNEVPAEAIKAVMDKGFI
jgi:2,5-furandicarboxylate decarboxylase 1